MKDAVKLKNITQERRSQLAGDCGRGGNAGDIFRKGSRVEVSSDDEGFRGAWYVATILDVPSNKRKTKASHKQYLVEYETLMADEDASKPLREYVDGSFMRPLPPTDDDHQQPPFELDEVVDAFYRDGWWTGVVTRVLDDNSTFAVFFQNPPDEIEFARSELRVHRDWVDREWVIPEKQRTMGSMYSRGTAVEVCLDKENFRDVWFLAIFLRKIGNNAFLVEYQSSDTDDEAGLSKVTVDTLHIRPSPPHLEYNNYVFFEEVDAFCGFGWWRGVITGFLKESRYTVLLKHTNEEKELNHREIRPHMDWIDGKWVIASQASKQQKVGVQGNQIVDMKRSTPNSRVRSSHASPTGKDRNAGGLNNQTIIVKRKRTPKSGVKTPHGSGTSKEGNARGINAEEIVESECVAEKPDTSVVKELECKKIRGSETENLHQLLDKLSVKLMGDKKKCLSHPESHNVRGIIKPEGRAWKRPAKLLVEKPGGLLEGEEKNGAETASYEMVVKNCATNEAVRLTETGVCFQGMLTFRLGCPLHLPIKDALNLITDGKKLLSVPRRHNNISNNLMNFPLAKIDNQSNETIAQKSGRQLKKQSSKRQIQSNMANSESHTQDCQDPCKGKTAEVFTADCTSKDAELVDEMRSDIFDDRTLLMWSEGMNSPSTVDASRVSLGKTVEQCAVASGRQDENAMQSPAKKRNLPFIKDSPLWETVENMEIFQMIPQQPHFLPLEKSKKDSREGLAIGSMVTFASAVERTSKLQFSDPRSTIDCTLETLCDLEIHGFDVDQIRERLIELLSKKDRQGQLLEKSKGVEMKIMEHNLEKSKIDGEIHEINKKIKELRKKLALATSMTEMKKYEIDALQSKMEVIHKDIQNAQQEFERLVAGPW